MIRASGIIPYCDSTNRFLLNLRSKDVAEPLTWSGWGGRAEEGEPLNVCALREFKEESGYTQDINLIRCYTYRAFNLVYINYITILKDEFTPILSWESADAQWFNIKEIHTLKNKHFGLIRLLNSFEFFEFLENLEAYIG
jgi:8-oxo-dGTP pyrophosphatase MutT (NUDIX family)